MSGDSGVTPLGGVLAADRRLFDARAGLDQAVERARDNGATWEEVGGVLGVSRQAAWERFRSVAATNRSAQ